MKSQLIIFLLLFLVSCKEVVKVKVSDLDTQLSIINQSLPKLCPQDTTVYSSCWKPFSRKEITFAIPHNMAESALSYYKNRGYQLSYNQGQLVFDFMPHHEKYLQHQDKFLSLESMFFLGIGSLFLMAIFSVYYRYYKKVQKVKALYQKDKNKLHFWDKLDRLKLEKELTQNHLPAYWNFRLNDDQTKIEGITYYNGRSMGRIAEDKEAFFNSLKAQLGLTDKMIQDRIDKRVKSDKDFEH